MRIETSQQGPDQLRLTLDSREVYLLKAALARACYIDIEPGDVEPVLGFAEELLKLLGNIGDAKG